MNNEHLDIHLFILSFISRGYPKEFFWPRINEAKTKKNLKKF